MPVAAMVNSTGQEYKPAMDHDKTQSPPAGSPADRIDAPRRRGEDPFDLEAFQQSLAPGARLIGIDVGTKTLGLALSDVSRTVASGLETIRRTKFKADVSRLLAIAVEHKIGGLVIGWPLNLDGTVGPRAQATRAFQRNLAAITDLPMLLWDERLSTQAAERTLLESDASRRRRAEVIDKMAATIILQNALDRMRRDVRATADEAGENE
jgi:putative Holliday junction resolvase